MRQRYPRASETTFWRGVLPAKPGWWDRHFAEPWEVPGQAPTPPRLDAWRRVLVPVLTGMTAIAVLFVIWLARLPGWQP